MAPSEKKKPRSAAQKANDSKLRAMWRGKGGGKKKSAPSNPGGGGGSKRSYKAASILSAKTVGSALVKLAEALPDVNVALGEGARVVYEGKPVADALFTAGKLELANYTGIRYRGEMTLSGIADRKNWKWSLAREPYDIPHGGRSPIKVGPIDTYLLKKGPKFVIRIAKKIPVLGKVLRKITSMRNPLKG